MRVGYAVGSKGDGLLIGDAIVVGIDEPIDVWN